MARLSDDQLVELLQLTRNADSVELKATVPIWKHQEFGDGGGEWVNSA